MKLAKGDFYNIRKDGKVLEGKVVIDRSTSKAAHRDAVQIIPSSRLHPRWQYMGGMIKDITVKNNVIVAPRSKLQGVFCSDGLIKNIKVVNNFIATESEHAITLSGVITGTFKGNESHIRLYPMRIGGGLGGEIFIMDFKQKKYNYKEVKADCFIADFRFKEIEKPTAQYLYNFDLEGFQKEAVKIKDENIKVFIKKLKYLALKFGTIR